MKGLNNDQGSKNTINKDILKDNKRKKLIVEVANPKTDEEYAKMIDVVNENLKKLYAVKD